MRPICMPTTPGVTPSRAAISPFVRPFMTRTRISCWSGVSVEASGSCAGMDIIPGHNDVAGGEVPSPPHRGHASSTTSVVIAATSSTTTSHGARARRRARKVSLWSAPRVAPLYGPPARDSRPAAQNAPDSMMRPVIGGAASSGRTGAVLRCSTGHVFRAVFVPLDGLVYFATVPGGS